MSDIEIKPLTNFSELCNMAYRYESTILPLIAIIESYIWWLVNV